MTRSNPFSQIFDALWSLVTNDDYLAGAISEKNRLSYEGTPEKDVQSTADVPELQLVPMGGSAMLLRTSSSTSCIRRFGFQLHTGNQNLHAALLPIEWALLSVLVKWTAVVGALRWNGMKYAVRMSTVDISEDMLRPKPEFGEGGLKGWYTIWVCEIECFFNSEQMKAR